MKYSPTDQQKKVLNALQNTDNSIVLVKAMARRR